MMKAPIRLSRHEIRRDFSDPTRLRLLEEDADREEIEVETFKSEMRGKVDSISNRITGLLVAIVLLGVGAYLDAAARGLT